jgi:hypothetical protein
MYEPEAATSAGMYARWALDVTVVPNPASTHARVVSFLIWTQYRWLPTSGGISKVTVDVTLAAGAFEVSRMLSTATYCAIWESCCSSTSRFTFATETPTMLITMVPTMIDAISA